MGVKSYLNKLISSRASITDILNKRHPSCDNFYIDANSLIYTNAQKVRQIEDIPRLELSEAIIKEIDELVQIIKPKKHILITIDGVAPLGKINQQRSRRFAKVSSYREGDFNTMNVTSGTKFMKEICIQLKNIIKQKVASDKIWGRCSVFFSDCNEPGEGEHKIMNFIRSTMQLPDYSNKEISYIYSVDNDLFIMCLGIHNPNFCILKSHNKGEYSIFYIEEVRKYLLDLFKYRNYCPDFERSVDDYIFLMSFFGNDFFPGFNEVSFEDATFDKLIESYLYTRTSTGEFLMNELEVNISFLKTLLLCFSKRSSVSFEEENEETKEKCKAAMKIFVWTYKYYKKGCIDWDFSYDFNSAPKILNFMNIISEDPIVFNKNTKPHNILQQLLMNTPPQFVNLLPQEMRGMVKLPELVEFFPEDPTVVGFNYNQRAILPQIKVKPFNEAFEKIELSEESKEMSAISKLVMLKDGEFVDADLPEGQPFGSVLLCEDRTRTVLFGKPVKGSTKTKKASGRSK